MKYSRLGNTGLIVSKIAFGAMTFGVGDFYGFKFTINTQKGADEMVGRSLDAGVNFFDTADMYSWGKSEEMLGRALGNRRKDVVVTTKAAARMSDTLINAGISYQHIIAAAEASLKRLGTDYIDLYLIHFDDLITPLEETLAALDNLVHRGLVRYIGYSNYPAWKAATALGIQRERNFARFVAAQMHYSLLGRDLEHEIVPFLQHAGLGLMVWSPLSGGFLTGKYTRDNPTGGGSRLATFNFPPVDKERGYEVVEILQEIAKARAATPAQAALAWLLSKPVVSSVIVGANNMAQLDENLGAANLELSAEELAKLDEITAPPSVYPSWMYERVGDPITYEALHGK